MLWVILPAVVLEAISGGMSCFLFILFFESCKRLITEVNIKILTVFIHPTLFNDFLMN